MKCPYRKETYVIANRTVENFLDCYEKECPFYGKIERKKRYEGGYYEVINPVCRRACEESEETGYER